MSFPFKDSKASEPVKPPSNPQTAKDFLKEVTSAPDDWYNFLCQLSKAFDETNAYNTSVDDNAAELVRQRDTAVAAHREATLRINQLTTEAALGRGGNSTAKSEKLPDPDPFTGSDRAALRSFIASIRMKMSINADRYPTEVARTSYLYGRLKDSAQALFLPHVQADGTLAFDEMEQMLKHLELAYGDPNPKATAQAKITELRQKNRDFASFAADFQRHINDTGYNDDGKKSMLYTSISNEIRNALVSHDTDDLNYLEFFRLCQRIDGRLRATAGAATNHTPQRRNFPTIPPSSNASPRSAPTTPQPVPVAHVVGDPMDLTVGRIRRGPITTEEKQWRFENNKCLYCGGDHMVRNCPKKPHSAIRALNFGSPSASPTTKPQVSEFEQAENGQSSH